MRTMRIIMRTTIKIMAVGETITRILMITTVMMNMIRRMAVERGTILGNRNHQNVCVYLKRHVHISFE